MHRTRAALAQLSPDGGEIASEPIAWTRDFLVGWIAGLIFFGTMLS
jgi:hypothetical protein